MRARGGRFVPHGERKVIVRHHRGTVPRTRAWNSCFRRAAYRMKTIGVPASLIARELDETHDYVSVTIRAKVVSGFLGSPAYGDARRSISATTACCWA